MLARAATIYLAALFVFGTIAALWPQAAKEQKPSPARHAAAVMGPLGTDAEVRVEPAILRDRLATPEHRGNDGIESDVRDRMKYRPLTSPMT